MTWYENNKERVLEKQRERYWKNKDKILEYQAEYFQSNKSKIMNRVQAYWDNNPAKFLFNTAKKRAAKYGIDFTITLDQIQVPEICPILGTPFVKRTMSAASLDRKDPTKGYIPGNVQVISRKANSMKSNATPEELQKFAQWIVFNV